MDAVAIKGARTKDMSTLAEKTSGAGRQAIQATTAAPLKVLIADDHPLVLLGLRRTLEAHEDLEIVGEAHSGPELIALAGRRRPDVVLMDLRMPGVNGGSCISQIAETWPHVKVVVLSACEDTPSIDAAFAAGASAYVVKSVNALDVASVLRQTRAGAVHHRPSGGVAAGARALGARAPGAYATGAHATGEGPSMSLTERETAILVAISRGLTTKSISRELWISEHTIKFHLTNIYRKLGVSNRSGAVRYAFEHGLASEGP